MGNAVAQRKSLSCAQLLRSGPMACPEHALVLRPIQVIRGGCSHRDWRRFLTSLEEDQCPTQSAHVPRGRDEGVLGLRRTPLHKLSAVACSGVRTAIMHALRLSWVGRVSMHGWMIYRA